MSAMVQLKPRKSILPIVPRRRKNTDYRQREYLTEAEIEKLLTTAGKSRNPVRDRLLVLLAYRHALRVSELVDLRSDQFDLKAAQVHIKRAKNGIPSIQGLQGDELSFGNSFARTASIAACCSLANAERRYPSMAHRSSSSGWARPLASNSPSMRICFATLLAMPWQGAAWTRGRCRSSWVIAPSATRRSTRPSQTSASATSGRPADRRVGTVVEGSNIQRHREPRNPS